MVISNGFNDYAVYDFDFDLNGLVETVDLMNGGVLVGGANPGNIDFEKPLLLRFTYEFAGEDLPQPEEFWMVCPPPGYGACEEVEAY